ncbi:DUF7269 family protein [Halopelagius longus]|uniref:Uncharacterized protein n=1 Tax=Halopelagius longus TaxID=1236180 RepID=A0A1H1GHY5_9EURY|nr:hypothetical protein [Halopelagius longus]RDI69598.1 hypothetical protein DWB78_17635 [Halopelagius longus]SDR12498.1 hypothetical protein SAMN05216278_3667 [Halopelagius longus]
MNRLRAFAGFLGVVAVAVAVALVVGVVPDGPVATAESAVASVDTGAYLFGLAAVAVLSGAWFSRRRPAPRPRTDAEARFESLRDAPPEAATGSSAPRPGGRFDGLLAEATDGRSEGSMRAVRDRLRALAAETYADVRNAPADEARRAVESGEWTDDRLAAATVADGDDASYPFGSRLRLWLDPARERRRRAERTLDAVRELRETGGGE